MRNKREQTIRNEIANKRRGETDTTQEETEKREEKIDRERHRPMTKALAEGFAYSPAQ
jgi:hypothetical protein